MKILHTADLHLGRYFGGHSLLEDHAAVLEQILAAIETHAPDVLIMAGDIFDRAAPPESAVRQFNEFLRQVSEQQQLAVVMIAGNHDSGERIGAMSMLADSDRVLVRGPLSAHEPALILSDDAGSVAISALPFGYEYAARACFADADIKAPADVLRAQIEAAKANVPKGARWVIVCHAFVSGTAATESERPLTRAVGGIETVPAEVFDGASYVALGHLHRAQSAGAPHIRYAGSPLAFGFDEERQEKSMVLADLHGDGSVDIELHPFLPLRKVRTLRGTLDELLGAGAEPSDDFIHVVLSDTQRRIDPMKRLRERFPKTCSLAYENLEHSISTSTQAPPISALNDPATLVSSFVEFARGAPMTTAERALLETKLPELARAGEEIAA